MKRLAILFLLLMPLVTFGAVTKLEFITSPLVVAPGAISDTITVQTQDAAGAKENITETADLTLVSSSPAGEFSSSNTNWQSTTELTMRTGSANRNFYYRDSTLGVHTLTITVKGRPPSNWSFTTQQTITVGTGTPTPSDDGNTNSTTTTPLTTTTTTTGDGPLSAHASQTPLSQVSLAAPFKVGAGRPRLGASHSSIAFSVETSGAAPTSINYQWSFGDGGVATGERVTHSYQFPGDYVVMINAIGANGQSVAVGRTTVSVIAPALAFGKLAVNGFELINHSAREVNLGGWRLNQSTASFVFPTDTILSANHNLIVPLANLGFTPVTGWPLTLTFPDGTVALETAGPARLDSARQVMASAPNLSELTESLKRLSAQLASLKIARQVTRVAPVSNLMSIPAAPSPIAAVGVLSSTDTVTTVVVPKPLGFFARIKQWFSQ